MKKKYPSQCYILSKINWSHEDDEPYYNFQNGKSLSSVGYVVYFFKSLLTFKAMLSFSEPDNELTTYADRLTEI